MIAARPGHGGPNKRDQFRPLKASPTGRNLSKGLSGRYTRFVASVRDKLSHDTGLAARPGHRGRTRTGYPLWLSKLGALEGGYLEPGCGFFSFDW